MPTYNDPYRRAAQEQADAEALVAQQQRTADRLAAAQAKQAAAEQEAAAKAARKAELSRQELELRAQGITPVTTADGNIHADPLHEQKQAQEQAEAEAKAAAEETEKKNKQSRAELTRQGIRHSVNPVDGSPIVHETAQDVETRLSAAQEAKRRQRLDEQIGAMQSEQDYRDAETARQGFRPLPRSQDGSRPLETKVLPKLKQQALLDLQTRLQQQSKAVTGGDDWVPFNEAPSPEAAAAQQRLNDISQPGYELSEDDLAELEADPATAPTVARIREQQTRLAKDDEITQQRQEHASKLALLKLRRDAPQKWLEAERARLAALPAEQFNAEMESRGAELEARRADMETRASQLNSQVALHQQKLTSLETEAALRRQQGIAAGKIVTYQNEDGTTEAWPEDLAAKREAITARLQDTMAMQQDDWLGLKAEQDEFGKEVALINNASKAFNARQKTVKQEQAKTAARRFQFTPGMEQVDRQLADLASEAQTRQQVLAEMHPDGIPQEALDAFNADMQAKTDALLNEGKTRFDESVKAAQQAWTTILNDDSPDASTPLLQAENDLAKKLGIKPTEARRLIDDAAKMTQWKTTVFGESGEAPGKTRLLSNGGIVVNPSITDKTKYAEAVAASGATPDAQADAIARFPQVREAAAREVLESIREIAAVYGQDSIADYTEHAKKRPKGVSEPEWAMQFVEKMQAEANDGFFGRTLGSITKEIWTSLNQGAVDLRQQASGFLGGLFGSETLMNDAAWAGRKSEALQKVKELGGDQSTNFFGQGLLTQIPRMLPSLLPTARAARLTQVGLRAFAATRVGARLLPSLAASIKNASTAAQAAKAVDTLTRAGLAGASVAGAAQTYGAQMADIYGILRREHPEMSHLQALQQAQMPAIVSGLATAALTALGGSSGVERLLTRPAEARQALDKAFASRLQQMGYVGKEFIKGGLKESFLEEIPDELISQIAAAVGTGKSVQQAVGEFVEQLPSLAVATVALGGFGEGVQAFRESSVNPEAGKPEIIAPAWDAISNHVATDAAGQIDQALTEQQQRRAALALSLAQGGELFDVEAADLAAAGWTRDGDKFKPLKDYTGPQVLDIDAGGLPVIKDSYIAALRQTGLAPVADAIPLSETQTRNFYAQRNNPTPNPADQPPGVPQQPVQTPVSGPASPAGGYANQSPVQTPAVSGTQPARGGNPPAPNGPSVTSPDSSPSALSSSPQTVADTLANHLAERGLERTAAAAAAEEIAARPEFDGMSYEAIIAEGPKFRAALDDLGIAGSLHSKHTATDPLRIQPGGRLEKVKAEMEAKAEAAKAAADPFASDAGTPARNAPDFAPLRQRLKNREISDQDAARQVAEAVGATTHEAFVAAMQQHLGWKPLRAEIASHLHFGTKDQSEIPMASAGRASNRTTPSLQNSTTPSRDGPDTSLAADPSPLRKNRAYAADKLRLLAGIKDASKKAWARQFFVALEQSLQRHHLLYDAYAVGGPARRHLDGQMTAVLEVEGKITRLIDLDAMVAQFDYLQSPQDALRATSIEEDIHAQVLQLAREKPETYGYAALRKQWQQLPDTLKNTVWTAYRAANQNTASASQARMPKLTPAQEWHMMNEFLRMLVQDAAFAGAITETVDPASGLIGWVQNLLRDLSRLLKNLMRKVQPDLRAQLDRQVAEISARLRQIEQASAAQKDRLAVLPSLRDPAAYATTVLQRLATTENPGILSDAALARVFDQLDPSLQSRAFTLHRSTTPSLQDSRKAPKHALLRTLLAQFLGSRADSQRLATALAGMQAPPKTTGLLTKIMDRLLDRVQAPEVLDLIAAQSPSARRDLKNLHIATLRAIGGIRSASFVHDLSTKPTLVTALESPAVNPVNPVNDVPSEDSPTAARRRADFLAALAAREQDHEDARNDENQLKLRQRLYAEESANPALEALDEDAKRTQQRLADFLAALDERDRQIELDHRDASSPAAGPALRRKLRQEELAYHHQLSYLRGEALAQIQLLTDQRRLPEAARRQLFDFLQVAAGRFEGKHPADLRLAGFAMEQALQRLGLRITERGTLVTTDPVNTAAYVERGHVIIRQETLDTVADLVPAVAAFLHFRLGSEYDQRQKHGLPTFAKPSPQTTEDPESEAGTPARPSDSPPEPTFTPLAPDQSPFAANTPPVSDSPPSALRPPPAPTARIPLGGKLSLPAQFATAEDLAAFQYQLDRDSLLREGTPEKDRTAARDRITTLRARLIDDTGASKEEVEQKLTDYHRAVIDAAKKADPVEVFRPVSFSNFLRARGTQAKADTLVAPEGGDLISALQDRVKRIGKISQSRTAGEWDWYRQLQQQVQAENAGRPLSRRQLQQAQKAAQNGDVSTPLNLLQWINLNVVDADKGMPIDEAATALSDTGKLDENDPNAQQPFDVDGTTLGESILAAIDARVALRDQGGDPALRQEAEAIRQGSDFRAVAEGAPGPAFTGRQLAQRLQTGDEIQLGSEWLTVTDIDPEEGTVALDSDRYGPQGLDPDQTIHLLAIGDEQFPVSPSPSLPVSSSPPSGYSESTLAASKAELTAALAELGLAASNRLTTEEKQRVIASIYAHNEAENSGTVISTDYRGGNAWLTPDNRYFHAEQHWFMLPDDADYTKAMQAGFVRLSLERGASKTLWAEFYPPLSTKKIERLRTQALMLGADLELDPDRTQTLASSNRLSDRLTPAIRINGVLYTDGVTHWDIMESYVWRYKIPAWQRESEDLQLARDWIEKNWKDFHPTVEEGFAEDGKFLSREAAFKKLTRSPEGPALRRHIQSIGENDRTWLDSGDLDYLASLPPSPHLPLSQSPALPSSPRLRAAAASFADQVFHVKGLRTFPDFLAYVAEEFPRSFDALKTPHLRSAWNTVLNEKDLPEITREQEAAALRPYAPRIINRPEPDPATLRRANAATEAALGITPPSDAGTPARTPSLQNSTTPPSDLGLDVEVLPEDPNKKIQNYGSTRQQREQAIDETFGPFAPGVAVMETKNQDGVTLPHIMRGRGLMLSIDGRPHVAMRQVALPSLGTGESPGVRFLPLAGDKSNWTGFINQAIQTAAPDLDQRTDYYLEPYGGGLVYLQNLDVLLRTEKPVIIASSQEFEPDRNAIYNALREGDPATLADLQATLRDPTHVPQTDVGRRLAYLLFPDARAHTAASAEAAKQLPRLAELLRRPNVQLKGWNDVQTFDLATKLAQSGKRVTLLEDSNYADLPGEETEDQYASLDAGPMLPGMSQGQITEFIGKNPRKLLAQKLPVYRAVLDAGGTVIATNNMNPTLLNGLLAEFGDAGHWFGYAHPTRVVPDGWMRHPDGKGVLWSNQRPEYLAILQKGVVNPPAGAPQYGTDTPAGLDYRTGPRRPVEELDRAAQPRRTPSPYTGGSREAAESLRQRPQTPGPRPASGTRDRRDAEPRTPALDATLAGGPGWDRVTSARVAAELDADRRPGDDPLETSPEIALMDLEEEIAAAGDTQSDPSKTSDPSDEVMTYAEAKQALLNLRPGDQLRDTTNGATVTFSKVEAVGTNRKTGQPTHGIWFTDSPNPNRLTEWASMLSNGEISIERGSETALPAAPRRHPATGQILAAAPRKRSKPFPNLVKPTLPAPEPREELFGGWAFRWEAVGRALEPRYIGFRGEITPGRDNGFGNTEGNGIYLMRSEQEAAVFGQVRRVKFPPPQRPFLVANDDLYLLQESEELDQPIDPAKDTPWLQINKYASQHATNLLKGGQWNRHQELAGDILTRLLMDAGYDSVYVQGMPDDWVVLLRETRPGQKPLKALPASNRSPSDAGTPARTSSPSLPLSTSPRQVLHVEPGFYSALAEAVRAKMPARATPAQILGILKNAGLKEEEMKWTGIRQWLQSQAQDGPITQDQVLAYLATEGSVKFTVTRLAGTDTKKQRRYLEHAINTNPLVRRAMDDEGMSQLDAANLPNKLLDGRLTVADLPRSLQSHAKAYLDAHERLKALGQESTPPRNTQWTLPGGTNPQEVVVTWNRPNASNTLREIGPQQFEILSPTGRVLTEFRGSREQAEAVSSHYENDADRRSLSPNSDTDRTHYGDLDALAWYRTTDRTNAAGNGLLVEEFQSKWHQMGREKGYVPEGDPNSPISVTMTEDGDYIATSADGSYTQRITGPMTPERAQIVAEHLRASRFEKRHGFIPDAPYRASWPLMLFKRALLDAVQSGKSWIGWTTGDTQADRYDLSKQVKRIDAKKFDQTRYEIAVLDKNDNEVRLPKEAFTAEELPEIVGKELAERIVSDLRFASPSRVVNYTGLDLRVGGQGMRKFYDDILVKEFTKYVKPWGGTVESSFLPFDVESNFGPGLSADEKQRLAKEKATPIHLIRITPQMRDSVTAGQALFASQRSPSGSPLSSPLSPLAPALDLRYLTPDGQDPANRARSNPLQENDLGGGPGANAQNPRQLPTEALQLLPWAQAQGWLIDPDDLDQRLGLMREIRAGDEHDVWHDELTDRAVKVTRLLNGKPVFIAGGPLAYALNLRHQNTLFGTGVTFEGIVEDEGQPRLVTSMPWVPGTAAEQKAKEAYFKAHGFDPAGPDTFYSMGRDLLVSDARPVNVLQRPDGTVQPIDIQVRAVSPRQAEMWENRVNAYSQGLAASQRTPTQAIEATGLAPAISVNGKAYTGRAGMTHGSILGDYVWRNVFTPQQRRNDPNQDNAVNFAHDPWMDTPGSGFDDFGFLDTRSGKFLNREEAYTLFKQRGFSTPPGSYSTTNESLDSYDLFNSQPVNPVNQVTSPPLPAAQRNPRLTAWANVPGKGDPESLETGYISGKHNDTIARRAAERGDIGLLVTPLIPSYLAHAAKYPFVAVDNGVFSKATPFSPENFRALVERVAETPAVKSKVLFVVAPDVVGDADRTLAQFGKWADYLHSRDLPAALAAQDGLEDLRASIPWDQIDVLFIGGSTEWKTGQLPPSKRAAWAEIFMEAHRRGIPIHMGRVNTNDRIAGIAQIVGASTVDGTYLAFGPDKNLPKLEAMLDELNVHGRDLGAQRFPELGRYPSENELYNIAFDEEVISTDGLGAYEPAAKEINAIRVAHGLPTLQGRRDNAQMELALWASPRLPVSPSPSLATQVATAAAQTDTTPTPAQKRAGNYAKGKVDLHGLRISIENPAGSTRSGTDASGKPWSITLPHHYGYILGSEGRDGDHVDVFIGPNPDSQLVLIINQRKGGAGTPARSVFDEHKVMLGFNTPAEAARGYMASYTKGWKGLQSAIPTTIPVFKHWLTTHDTTQPVTPAQIQKLAKTVPTPTSPHDQPPVTTVNPVNPVPLAAGSRILQRAQALDRKLLTVPGAAQSLDLAGKAVDLTGALASKVIKGLVQAPLVPLRVNGYLAEQIGLQEPLASFGSNNLDKRLATQLDKLAGPKVRSAKAAVETWLDKPDGLAPSIKGIVDQLLPTALLPREWLALHHEMQRKTAYGQETANDLIRALSGNPRLSDLAYPKEFAENPAARAQLFDAMEGRVPMATLPPAMQRLGQRLRDLLRQTGSELVRQGLMNPDTFEELQSNGWMPRYTEDEARESAGSFLAAFKLGVRDLLQQRSTAYHIVDTTRKDKTGQFVTVSRDEGGKRNRWRFRDAASRDAFYHKLIRQHALTALQEDNKHPHTKTLLDALDAKTRREVRADIKKLTLDEMELTAKVSPALARLIKSSLHDQANRFLPKDPFEPAKLIKDPVYAVARYVLGQTHNAATMELLRKTAQHPEWVSDTSLTGFEAIPDASRFGPLAGKHVRKDIARQVLDLVDVPNAALQFYDAILRKWKAGKLVWNPGSHIRDAVGNTMFAFLAGSSIWNPGNWPYYQQAIAALRTGGKDFAELIEQQVIGGDAYTGLVKERLKGLLPDPKTVENYDPGFVQRMMFGFGATLHGSHEFLASLRRLPDDLFKAAAYFKAKADQHSTTPSLPDSEAKSRAAQHVRTWFPYYDRLGQSGTTRAVGRFVNPFFAFFRESTRILGTAVVERPLALTASLAFPALITAISAMALGLDDDDMEEIQKDMAGKGKLFATDTPLFSMLLPFRSAQGAVQQFDISAIMPFADLLGTRVAVTDATEDPWNRFWRGIVAGGPVLSLVDAWRHNEDAFTRRPIAEFGMTPLEKITAYTKHAAGVALPPLAPGGTAFNTLMRAGDRSTNKTLETYDPAQAVIRSVAGLNVKNATPDLYRLADDWRKAHGYEVTEGMDYGSTTPASRARKALFAQLAQDQPNLTAIANILKSLDKMGHPVRTEQDINRLLFYRDPMKLIGGNKARGITPQDAQAQFRASLQGEARQALENALQEFQRIKQRAPTLIRQAASTP